MFPTDVRLIEEIERLKKGRDNLLTIDRAIMDMYFDLKNSLVEIADTLGIDPKLYRSDRVVITKLLAREILLKIKYPNGLPECGLDNNSEL